MNLFLKNQSLRKKLPKINYAFLFQFLCQELSLKERAKLVPKRDVAVSPIYNNTTVYVHQGRVVVRMKQLVQKTSYKLGMFAATKKPFNFREKKKKR